MRRPVLVTLVVLGSLISLVGSTGLFAALTDTAQTGLNAVDSKGLAPSADIQLAIPAEFGFPVDCGEFSDHLTTGLYSGSTGANALGPGSGTISPLLCIRNVGSQSVDVSVGVIELTDVEIACTGDEGEFDDTCGTGDGELSTVLKAIFIPVDCSVGGGSGWSTVLSNLAATPVPLEADLAAGATACYQAGAEYPSSTSATAVQIAQSDSVTWRFQFGAAVAP